MQWLETKEGAGVDRWRLDKKSCKKGLGGAKRGVIGRNHSFPGGRQAVQDATKMPLLSGKDQIGSHEKLVFALCV